MDVTKTASILLPTYNEAHNVCEIVRAVFAAQPPGWQFQVIVIDDNSPDKTYEVAHREFVDDPRVLVILRTQDRGLAKSLFAGLQKATGDWIVFMGADFTHDPVELPKLLHVAQIYEIAMGSRFCAGGTMEFLPHYYVSLIYNWFIRLILRTQIQDNLGGYIAIQKKCLDQLPLEKIFIGYGEFAFRMLHYAQQVGMRIVEVPAHFRTRQKGRSKSQFVFLLFKYTIAVFRLKFEVVAGH